MLIGIARSGGRVHASAQFAFPPHPPMETIEVLPGYYYIRLQELPDLVLTDMNGNAMLEWRMENLDSQLWSLTHSLADGSYTFTNKYSNAVLGIAADGRNLSLGSQGIRWAVGAALNNFSYIRSNTNEDQNLNALGDGPHDADSVVGVYSWGGGASNELWQIVQPEKITRTIQTVQIVGSAAVVGVQDGDTEGKQPLVGKRSDSTDDTVLFYKIDYPGFGVSLRSKYNGKLIYWRNSNDYLGQVNKMSLRCLWTVQNVGLNANAIRAYLDDDQNFNFYQNPSSFVGVPLYTWGWGGGDRNELFYLFERKS